MFEALANSTFGLWILALLIILIDSTVFLSPGQFTFFQKRATQVLIRVVRYPFLLRGREPVLTLFTYCGLPFSICTRTSAREEKKSLRRKLSSTYRATHRFRSLSVYSWFGMIAVFLVGPIISLQYGVALSALVVWPITYAIAAGVLAVLWVGKRDLNLSPKKVAWIGVEFLFCPFLAVNVWKKIALEQPREINVEILNRHFSANGPIEIPSENNTAEELGTK